LGLYPHTREGVPIRIPTEDWVLDGEPWSGDDILYLVHSGLGYIFTGWWDDDHTFGGWKIDLTEPVRRTSLGFDYMDQLLDIMVSADRSTWHWKDEDEVQEALAQGMFTAEQVQDLYQRGEHALQSLLANEPPFDRVWESWVSDPAWRVTFDFPQGWEQI
jgi:predicted RNA-binding protein associated with RNAse of E/G family